MLSKDEQFVRRELTKIYPQLIINARKTCGQAYDKHGHDLLALAIEFFLLKPLEDQLLTIKNGKMENFITFIMATQLKSGTSKFYTTYRRHHEKQRELYDNYDYSKYETEMVSYNDAFEDEESELMACIRASMKELNIYHQMLIEEKILNNKTYKHISKTYNINYASLKKDTVEALDQIKQLCQHLR